MPLTVVCNWCGKDIERSLTSERAARMKGLKNRYCNHSCWAAHQNFRGGHEMERFQCAYCGKETMRHAKTLRHRRKLGFTKFIADLVAQEGQSTRNGRAAFTQCTNALNAAAVSKCARRNMQGVSPRTQLTMLSVAGAARVSANGVGN